MSRKIAIALAAVAVAMVLVVCAAPEEDSGRLVYTDFEDDAYKVGDFTRESLYNGSFEYDWYFSTNKWDNSSVITNSNVYGDIAIEIRPDAYVADTNNTKLLQVSTAPAKEDQRLGRRISSTPKISKDETIYVDMDVRFTVASDMIEDCANDKLVVWVADANTGLDDLDTAMVRMSTNIIITAGYVLPNGSVTLKHYIVRDNMFNIADHIDEWHRLTVAAVLNGSMPSFKVAVDNIQLEAFRADDPTDVRDIFPSLLGSNSDTLGEVVLEGKGTLDNFVVTTTDPDFHKTMYFSVNGQQFATFLEAAAAAEDNDTIELLANYEGVVYLVGDKALTLDLAGHSITNAGDNNTISVAGLASLTITGGGSISAAEGRYAIMAENGSINIEGDSVTNITLTGGIAVKDSYDISIYSPADATYNVTNITDGTSTNITIAAETSESAMQTNEMITVLDVRLDYYSTNVNVATDAAFPEDVAFPGYNVWFVTSNNTQFVTNHLLAAKAKDPFYIAEWNPNVITNFGNYVLTATGAGKLDTNLVGKATFTVLDPLIQMQPSSVAMTYSAYATSSGGSESSRILAPNDKELDDEQKAVYSSMFDEVGSSSAKSSGTKLLLSSSSGNSSTRQVEVQLNKTGKRILQQSAADASKILVEALAKAKDGEAVVIENLAITGGFYWTIRQGDSLENMSNEAGETPSDGRTAGVNIVKPKGSKCGFYQIIVSPAKIEASQNEATE